MVPRYPEDRKKGIIEDPNIGEGDARVLGGDKPKPIKIGDNPWPPNYGNGTFDPRQELSEEEEAEILKEISVK